jgi:hypothetical protein
MHIYEIAEKSPHQCTIKGHNYNKNEIEQMLKFTDVVHAFATLLELGLSSSSYR